MNQITSQIRTRREALGWTQKQLSDRSGISTWTIGQIESGQSKGNLETVEKLFDAMDCKLSVIGKSWQPGHTIKITDLIQSHGFEIGEKVMIIEGNIETRWHRCFSEKNGFWWVKEDEGVLID